MKNKLKKWMKGLMAAVIHFKLLGQCMYVNAAGLENTKLVQGAKLLMEDGTKVFMALEAGLIVVLLIKEGIAYQMAEVEEKKVHKKDAKGILGVGILIVCATGLVGVVLSYFM